MKIATLLLWCGLGALPAHANPLFGTWQYEGFTYQGHYYPNPNPDLNLTMSFNDNLSHLYWRRTKEPGFCERLAEYTVADNVLSQKITWVNPKNNAECAKDPDMQLGSESKIRFRSDGQYLELFFEIRGQEFIYILTKTGCVFE